MASGSSLIDMADDEIEFRLRGDTGFGSTSTPAAPTAPSTIVRRPFCTPEELDGFFRPPSDRQPVVDHDRPRPEIDKFAEEVAKQLRAVEA